MGGNGTIGGGSCKLFFHIKGKPDLKEDDNDPGLKGKYKVKVEFSDGTVRFDDLDGADKDKKIKISWPH